jgi:aryl-alcohol dehydrogenase-like predicted oxidoreductase
MGLGPDQPAAHNAGRYVADKAAGIRCVRRAVELGVKHFDTAHGYGGGFSEAWLGEAVGVFPRESVILTTKFGAGGKVLPAAPHVYARANILAACDRALREMRVSYLDFLMFHHPGFDTYLEEALDAMETLRSEGKIRFYANSIYHSVPEVVGWYPRLHPGHWHAGGGPLWNDPNDAGLEFAAKRREGVVVMAPLLSGVLTGHWDLSNAEAFREKYAAHWWFKEHDMDLTLQAMDRVKEWFGGTEQGFLTAILQYCLALPGVVSVLPGFRTLEQVEGLAAAVNAPPLATGEMAFLRETLREDHTRLGQEQSSQGRAGT